MKLCMILIFTFGFTEVNAESLSEILQKVYVVNPEILAEVEAHKAEENLTTAASWLEDPIVGISSLNRGNNTTYGVISQKIRFPVKYFLQNKVQKNRALAQKAKVLLKKI